jgi:hypothetical protein
MMDDKKTAFSRGLPHIQGSAMGTELDRAERGAGSAAPGGTSSQAEDPGPARSRISKAWSTIGNWFSKCFEAAASCGFSRSRRDSKAEPSESPPGSNVSEHQAIPTSSADNAAGPSVRSTPTMKAPDNSRAAVAGPRVREPPRFGGNVDIGDTHQMELLAGFARARWNLQDVHLLGRLVLGGPTARTGLALLAEAGVQMSQLDVMADPANRDSLKQLLRLVRAGMSASSLKVEGTFDVVRDSGMVRDLLELARAGVSTSRLEVRGTPDVVRHPDMVSDLLELRAARVDLKGVLAQGAVVCDAVGAVAHLKQLLTLADAGVNVKAVQVTGRVDSTNRDLVMILLALGSRVSRDTKFK